jgi:hypothetical protein
MVFRHLLLHQSHHHPNITINIVGSIASYIAIYIAASGVPILCDYLIACRMIAFFIDPSVGGG